MEAISATQDTQDTQDTQEIILQPNPNRHVIFPIEYPDLWDLYNKHVAVFWTVEEVDLSKDIAHWEKLSNDERHFIKYVLGFFAGSDGIVMENLATRFMREVQIPEARMFYACQNFMESIHSVQYALLIDTYIKNKTERVEMLRAIQTVPCVQKKANWALQWIDNDKASFATRLVAFAVVEGVFFSGSFCAIYWIKQRAIMPGLTLSNEFISRDEGLHTTFACTLYSKLGPTRLTQKEVETIMCDAVEIEKYFITEALPCRLIGMNSDMMSRYIEFVADRLLVQLGYERVYKVANPFPFMERIGYASKDSFFEKQASTYVKAGVGQPVEKMVFSMDADF